MASVKQELLDGMSEADPRRVGTLLAHVATSGQPGWQKLPHADTCWWCELVKPVMSCASQVSSLNDTQHVWSEAGHDSQAALLTWQGKRAHKIFTTRDGQTGYYFGDPVEVDSSEFLATQSLGWLKSPAPEKEEQSQPAAVNKGLQAGVAAAKKAQQFELKPVTTPAVEYGHRACWGLVNRLRKNPTRLAEQSEELQQLIVSSATNEADKKKLYGIIAGRNGVLKDINVKVEESFETCDVENEKTETVPVTELELQAMYGEQTESFKRHKEATRECKDDPNLPGAKIYLLAREKVEAGTEAKRRCLIPSQLQFLICFPIKL